MKELFYLCWCVAPVLGSQRAPPPPPKVGAAAENLGLWTSNHQLIPEGVGAGSGEDDDFEGSGEASPSLGLDVLSRISVQVVDWAAHNDIVTTTAFTAVAPPLDREVGEALGHLVIEDPREVEEIGEVEEEEGMCSIFPTFFN